MAKRWLNWLGLLREIGQKCLKRRRMRRRRLHVYSTDLGDPRGTCLAGIDGIKPRAALVTMGQEGANLEYSFFCPQPQ